MNRMGFTPLEIKEQREAQKRQRYFLSLTGFTLIETLIVVAIFVFIVGGIFAVFSVGRAGWYQAELSIQLKQSIRNSMNRLIRELHESGCENSNHNPPDICESGEYKIEIADNAGENNTDKLKFSAYLDCNGNKRWQATLYWACKSANCLDTDADCATVEYSKIEYLINANRQLIRRVLDAAGSTVREDVVANNINDFQVTRQGDNVTLQLTASGTDAFARQLTYNLSNQVYLRNLFKE